MKRLTINRIAQAFLRSNRRQQKSLIITVTVSVFLATAVIFAVYGMIRSDNEDVRLKVGDTDCVIFDSPEITDETLKSSSLFSQIGNVYVSGLIDGTDIYTGYPDDSAMDILITGCLEGRMPQNTGEIAIEADAFERLRLDIAVGDSVTLDITPVDGISEHRTFTLVGILREQADYFQTYSFMKSERSWPEILTCEDEAFQTGRNILHRVMIYAPLVTYTQVLQSPVFADDSSLIVPVSRSEGNVYFPGFDPLGRDLPEYLARTYIILLLGLSLLLVCGIGISFAAEGVLAEKTEDIAMMRAVGATRRQIRRIAGRQIWLIFLTAIPVGMLAGLLAVWIISILLPSEVIFSFSPILLVPVIIISGLCILIASSRPLKRASSQMPMSVLRDTELIRKTRSVRAKETFKPAELIAGRQLLAHPVRMAGGGAVMVCLTLLCAVLIGGTFYGIPTGTGMAEFSLRAKSGAYMISGSRFAIKPGSVKLTLQDLNQISSIPQVKKADTNTLSFVNILLESDIPDYLKSHEVDTSAYGGQTYTFSSIGYPYNNTDYLFMDDTSADPDYLEMKDAMSAAETDKKPIAFRVNIISSKQAEELSGYITDGKIDIDAVNSGESVIIAAPDISLYYGNGNFLTSTQEELPYEKIYTLQNDYFHAGQTLDIIQFVDDTDSDSGLFDYSSMKKNRFGVNVAAVTSSGSDGMAGMITTEEGAKALGLVPYTPMDVSVYLTGDVDNETEKELESRLSRIAMRGGLEVTNLLESVRKMRNDWLQQFLLFVSMMLLFFTASIALQTGNASRRICADERMIGTLRAVGAGSSTLLKCFSTPVLISCGAGTALAIIIFLIFYLLFISFRPELLLVIPAMILFGLLSAACSAGAIRSRLTKLLQKSIVENIREL